jgi:hypothetical protein
MQLVRSCLATQPAGTNAAEPHFLIGFQHSLYWTLAVLTLARLAPTKHNQLHVLHQL